MHKEQPPEKPEPGEVEVTGEGCLVALFADDPHADVCLLDHAHIVAPIADGQRDLVQLALDILYQQGFLLGRRAAAYDGAALRYDSEELVADLFGKEHVVDGVPLDYEGKIVVDLPCDIRLQVQRNFARDLLREVGQAPSLVRLGLHFFFLQDRNRFLLSARRILLRVVSRVLLRQVLLQLDFRNPHLDPLELFAAAPHEGHKDVTPSSTRARTAARSHQSESSGSASEHLASLA